MMNTKNKFSQKLKTLRHKMHNNRRIPSRSKMHDNLRTPSASRPKTTNYHKTSSVSGHDHLMYQTDMWSKSIQEENGGRRWKSSAHSMDEGGNYRYEHKYEKLI